MATKDDILERLDTMIRLQAQQLVSQMESQKEKIIFLKKAGLAPKDIAVVLNTTQNSVNVAISKARKAGELKDGNDA